MTTTDPTLLPSTDGLSLMPDTAPEGGRGVNPDEAPERAQRAGTRTRTRSSWRSAPRSATPSGKGSPPQFTPRPATSLWTAQPPSLAAVWHRVRSGWYIRGQHPWQIEAPGYVYGAVVALPVTALLYAIQWLTETLPKFLATAGCVALVLAAWRYR